MNEHAGVDLSIDGFERGEIDLESFDHEAHLHLAWLYLEQFPLPEALERFDAALRRLIPWQAEEIEPRLENP